MVSRRLARICFLGPDYTLTSDVMVSRIWSPCEEQGDKRCAFSGQPPRAETPIVELVSQRFAAGERDRMVALFERQVADVQEALGASVLGSFTVKGQPDRFIWMRGFSDMAARRAALGRPNTGAGWPLQAGPAPSPIRHQGTRSTSFVP